MKIVDEYGCGIDGSGEDHAIEGMPRRYVAIFISVIAVLTGLGLYVAVC